MSDNESIDDRQAEFELFLHNPAKAKRLQEEEDCRLRHIWGDKFFSEGITFRTQEDLKFFDDAMARAEEYDKAKEQKASKKEAKKKPIDTPCKRPAAKSVDKKPKPKLADSTNQKPKAKSPKPTLATSTTPTDSPTPSSSPFDELRWDRDAGRYWNKGNDPDPVKRKKFEKDKKKIFC